MSSLPTKDQFRLVTHFPKFPEISTRPQAKEDGKKRRMQSVSVQTAAI
jgi:hypothetical protein